MSEKTSVFLTQPKTGRSLVNFALPFVLQSEWGFRLRRAVP
ncbi:integrase [Escherichia coli TW09109]|nr:integrase [Escherichia coli TW09109]